MNRPPAKRKNLGILSLEKLRDAGAFVQPTGKRGRPVKSFGARNRLHAAVVHDVGRQIAQDTGPQYGKLTRAVNAVSAARRMKPLTVRTIWMKSPIARVEIRWVLEFEEIRRWFDLLPADVVERLSRCYVRDLLSVLRERGIDHCTSADFCARVRTWRQPSAR